MPQFSNQFNEKAGNFAFLSMATGLASLFSLFNPPIGLLLGSAACILAYLTYTCRRRLGAPAIIGSILGVIGILVSLLIFFNYLFVIRFLDNPEALIGQISDPVKAQQFRDLIAQYKDMIRQLQN